MRYLALLFLVVSTSIFAAAQAQADSKRFPMALDSFYMQVKFVDGGKMDYEVSKTKDSIWLVTDTVLYNMTEFKDLETMFMFLMHVRGVRTESYLIRPMLPADIDEKLINRRSERAKDTLIILH